MNFYPEVNPMPGAKSKVQLYPTPGVRVFAESTFAPARGSFAQDGRCWFVLGDRLCSVTTGGFVVSLGVVAVDSRPATLAANGDGGQQLFVVSGGGGYILSTATLAFTPVVSGAVMAAYLNGFFMYLDTQSRLFVSQLFNGLVWDAADVQVRSAAPDPWVAVSVNRGDKVLWLFGQETSEAWAGVEDVASAALYPFAPIPGGLINYGCAAPFSVTQVGSALMWLARTSEGQGEVVLLQGLAPKVVSTPAFETAIESYARIDDAVGDSYHALGHTFYVLTFPTANATWVYDLSTNLWHQRGIWIAERNEFDALRMSHFAFAFGKQLVGDRQGSHIYDMALDAPTDIDDRPIRRVRRGPSISIENKRLFYPAFELLLENGLGTLEGQGQNPLVGLRCSNDGGKTWGPQLTRSAGLRGQYGRRVRWTRLGSARDRQFEIDMSDPVPYRLIDAFIEVEAGMEALTA